MLKKKALVISLTVSILANLAVFACGSIFVYRKGGMAYIHAHLRGGGEFTTNGAGPGTSVRQSLFKALVEHSGQSSLVFLGDSITEFCEWDELLGVKAINRGISGDTTSDVLNRLDTVTAIHPSSVFLMVGINDAGHQVKVQTATDNYRDIIRRIHASSPNTIIYAQTVLPVNSSLADAWLGRGRGVEMNEWVRSMNQNIRDLSDGKTVIFVDLYSAFLSNGELDPEYTFDGVHVNGNGYLLWKRTISPFLIHNRPDPIS